MNTPSTTERPLGKRLALMIVISCGLAAMIPAYIWGIPLGADLDNHFRFAMPFFDELSRGNIIPGWLAESNMGFGDPRFRFYPPFIYYLLSTARWVTGEWYYATLLVFSLFSVVGALGVYVWARQSLSPRVAVCAAMLFTLMPYHLAQFYQASLLAEFAAMSLLPFAFLFVERIMVGSPNSASLSTDSALVPILTKRAEFFAQSSLRIVSIAGLALSFALIVITHLPTMIVGSLSLGLFALLSTDWKRNKRALIFAAAGIGLGLVLSSFFWVKMLSELSWIQAGTKVTSEHYDYRNNFLFSPYSLVNLNSWFGSLIAALTVGIALPTGILLKRIFRKSISDPGISARQSQESTRRSTRAALLVALAAIFMTTDLSRPIWAIVPKLKDIQFPFRWLTVVSVLICPLVAASIFRWFERIRQRNIRAWHLPVFLAFGIAVFISIYEFAIKSDFLDCEVFTTRITAARSGPSFPDWLPNGAAELKDVKPMQGPVDAGYRQVISSDIQTHHRRFSLAAGDAAEIRIRAYYYPLWKASVTTASGTLPAETKQAADGTLLVAVPAERCEVSVDFGGR